VEGLKDEKLFSLLDNSTKLCPAEDLYYGLKRNEASPLLTTNGCALYSSKEEAVIRALYECIERDSVLMNWYSKRGYKRVSLKEYYSPALQTLLTSLEKASVTVRYYDATGDSGIPILLTRMDDLTLKQSFFGFAVCRSIDGACMKAITEAIGTSLYAGKVEKNSSLSKIRQTLARSPKFGKTLALSTRDRMHLFKVELLPTIEPLFKDSEDGTSSFLSVYEKSKSIKSVSELTAYIQSHNSYLVSKGVWVYHYPSEDVKEGGLYVCRAIVPALQDLTITGRQEVNMERFRNFVQNTNLDILKPNPLPHIIS
jgi:ribosomal protein S12 methylthiotransferase accessory factor